MAKPKITTVRFLLKKNATVNSICVDSSKPNKSLQSWGTNTNFSTLFHRLRDIKITCFGHEDSSLLLPTQTKSTFTSVRSAIRNVYQLIRPDKIPFVKNNTLI